MKNLIHTRCFVAFLFLMSLVAPSGAKAGPFAAFCIPICNGVCIATVCAGTIAAGAAGTIATGGAALPLVVAGSSSACLACLASCTISCLGGTCFSEDTHVTLLEHGIQLEKKIELVQAGDIILTLASGQPAWTTVLRNFKTRGEFGFVQITTRNLQDGSERQIKVTPEHGLILINDQGEKTIDSARNVRTGDRMISSKGDIVSVIAVFTVTMDEKYTLETSRGTVLASDLLVTTICSEEVSGGERLFEPTMKDWCMRHNFTDCQ